MTAGTVTILWWVFFVAALACGVGFVAGRLAQAQRRPIAHLHANGGSFSAIAPTGLHVVAAVAAALFGIAFLAWTLGPVAPRGGWEYVYGIAVVEFFALAMLCMCRYVANVVAQPGVVIRPDGVELRGYRRQTLVTWRQLEANHDALYDAGLRGIATTNRPAPHSRGSYSLRRLGVEPTHIVHVISYYLTHPPHRPAIGKPDEYHRILAVMATATVGPVARRATDPAGSAVAGEAALVDAATG